MAKVKVKLISRGMADLLTSAGVAADGKRRGDRVASAMRAGPPRDTGEYADNIVVTQEVHGDRVVTKIGSTAKHAPVVEANTGNAARALDAGGA